MPKQQIETTNFRRALEFTLREFQDQIERQRREGLGWRIDGLESWSTEEIFAKLRELGIDTDAERFVQQARNAGRIKVLDDEWDRQYQAVHDREDLWRDFPLMSVPLLWERLAGDVLCPELIERGLHAVLQAEDDGEPLSEVDGLPAGVAAALGLVKYLARFPVAERADLFQEINRAGDYEYVDWLINLIDSANAEHLEAICQIADGMSEVIDAELFQAELASMLARSGRREEAIARSNALIERFPDDLWVKVRSGDLYETLKDDAQAVKLWIAALKMATEVDDWDAVAERIEEAFSRMGGEEDLNDIFEDFPRPAEPVLSPPPAYEPSVDIPPPPQLTRAKVVGRNEPCPCGSGKKYKKCCMP